MHTKIIFTAGKKVGQMILYFGCRYKDRDFIYQDEVRLVKSILEENIQLS